MTQYIVIHEHRFGADGYLLESEHAPDDREIVAALGLDFEPDREEVLTISVATGNRSVRVWDENDSHGEDCAMRTLSSAECTCGKADYFSRLTESVEEDRSDDPYQLLDTQLGRKMLGREAL